MDVNLERALTEDEIIIFAKDIEELTLEECRTIIPTLVEAIREGGADMLDTLQTQKGDFNLLNWTNEEVAQASLDLSNVLKRGFELMRSK